jgi:hypothetical protein
MTLERFSYNFKVVVNVVWWSRSGEHSITTQSALHQDQCRAVPQQYQSVSQPSPQPCTSYISKSISTCDNRPSSLACWQQEGSGLQQPHELMVHTCPPNATSTVLQSAQPYTSAVMYVTCHVEHTTWMQQDPWVHELNPLLQHSAATGQIASRSLHRASERLQQHQQHKLSQLLHQQHQQDALSHNQHISSLL